MSRNVALRNELDLYVNVVECKSYEGVPARQKNIDIAIVRQNTEGEYAMLEHEVSSCVNYRLYHLRAILLSSLYILSRQSTECSGRG